MRLRTTSQAVALVVVGVGGAAILVALALSSESGSRGAAGVIVGFVLAAVCLVACIRLALCSATVEPDGLVVRNPTRTHLYPWAEIQSFHIERHGVWPRVCVMATNDGSRIAIWGIQGRGPAMKSKRDPAYKLAERLNDAVASHEGEPGPQ
jgi:hypothetical protein